jgi:cyclohexa-1,5-dienecarbonyl-CoA hydratase
MTVTLDVREGVAHVVLDHPPLNILTRSVLGSLRDALAGAGHRADVRVVLLRAQGKHFSAGADVGEHLPPEFREMIPEFTETVKTLRDFPVPVVAAVRGKCLGGGFELVQGADMVVAGEGALLGQPEIMLGVMAPAASVMLPLLGSKGAAARILFTGDPLTAREALEAGLVTLVTPDDEVEDRALELCRRIARHSGAALRVAKSALRAGERAYRDAALDEAERLYVEELMDTADALEGLQSFLEKRRPAWTHS